MANDLEDFTNQLEQEELCQALKANNAKVDDRIRTDKDGTVYEYDPYKQAWFPKIDEDFIANYQMSYGINQAADSNQSKQATNTVAQNTFPSDYFTNPPTDINSEEYRVWYENYCKVYYSQSNYHTPTTNINSELDGDFYTDCNLNKSMPQISSMNSKENGNKKDKKKKKATDPGVNVLEKKASEPAWFDIEENKNTNVYVTGLPTEISEIEFKELMSKVGLLAFDPIMKKSKIKLYTDEDGNFKGDGRCCYIKSESVDLALKILDGSNFNGHTINVERARFEQKGQYDPARKKRKLTKQEKKKFQEKQEKLLGWTPEKVFESRPRHEKVVILKNVFNPKDFEENPALMTEISADVREECKKFGEVKRVVIYDRHNEGIVTVNFKSPEEADLCIKALNGRWFDKHQLIALQHDGRTKYVVSETEQEMEDRLKKWYSYLEEPLKANAIDGSNESGKDSNKKRKLKHSNDTKNHIDSTNEQNLKDFTNKIPVDNDLVVNDSNDITTEIPTDIDINIITSEIPTDNDIKIISSEINTDIDITIITSEILTNNDIQIISSEINTDIDTKIIISEIPTDNDIQIISSEINTDIDTKIITSEISIDDDNVKDVVEGYINDDAKKKVCDLSVVTRIVNLKEDSIIAEKVSPLIYPVDNGKMEDDLIMNSTDQL